MACLIIFYFAGDIWSENGVALLGVMGYWIDRNFELQEKLLVIEGWGVDAHTGDNIKKKTLEIMHNQWGIGESPEDVPNRVHGSTPDEGSNMLKGWNCFEGSSCVCHRVQNALKCALNCTPGVVALVKKVKGICSHFHRSTKVCIVYMLRVFAIFIMS